MTSGRLRASVVIALVVVASALAGAAIERLAFSSMMRHGPWSGAPNGPSRGSPEREARRRGEMLDRMTKELALTAAQRTSIDSVMQRTDSSLRTIRSQMQPRIEAVFDSSRAAIAARLDERQKVEFAKKDRRRR